MANLNPNLISNDTTAVLNMAANLMRSIGASVQVIDEVPGQKVSAQMDLPTLRQTLVIRFDESELRDLCFDLHVDYDGLRGDGKGDKARELVAHLERHNRIQELVEIGKKLCPSISWGGTHQATEDSSSKQLMASKHVLTPEMILLALIRVHQSTAYRLLSHLASTQGLKLSDLEREAEEAARVSTGHDADFTFTAEDNSPVRISDSALIALDEAHTIAQAMDEVWIGPEHLLATLCQAGISTAELLQRYGITPTVMVGLLSDRTLTPATTTQDRTAQVRSSQLISIHYRKELLHELMILLSQAIRHHVILVGAPGSGRRTLVYSLSLLVAEGKAPASIKSVVEIAEQALLDNSVEAVRAGIRQAKAGGMGILFLPNIHRFLGGPLKAEFAQAEKTLQKAFFDEAVVVVGTTTEADYAERLQSFPTVIERSQVLRVPPTTPQETTLILQTLKARFEMDYQIQIGSRILPTVTVLATRYLTGQALPGAAVQLLHRACTLVRMSMQDNLAFRPDMPPKARVDGDTVLMACSQMTGMPMIKLANEWYADNNR